MKKTLIALAALAAFGSASAEVVLYGKVDLGVSSSTTTGGTDQGLEVTGNNYEGSRVGVKGGTDLGAGVKAIFQYEFGVSPSEYNKGLANDRVTMIGLTGGFGTVGLGLQWTPYDSAWGWDATEYNKFSAPGQAFYKGAHGDNGFTGNGNAKKAISYTTPSMNGFDATFMYANGADKTAAVEASRTYALDAKTGTVVGTNNPAVAAQDATRYLGIGANYANGPIAVNFGWESVPSKMQNSSALQADKTSAWILGASYDLGVAKIGGAFEQANVDITNSAQLKDAGWTLSVAVPVNKQTTVAASYASETTTQSNVTDGTAKAFGGQVIYNWTTQAAIYAGAYQLKSTELGKTNEVTTTKYAAGLRYNF